MEQNRNKHMAAQLVRTRCCLGCHRSFTAEGPFLRICPLCKQSEEWLSGDGDFALHAMGAANDN
jgi:hypothetical protein